MNQIKFSHHYQKLHKIDTSKPVTLVEIVPTSTNILSSSFLEYDTVYWKNGEMHHYALPLDMECLILLFVDSNGTMFTTIRRATEKKISYYLNSIGDAFEVVFT